MGQIRRLCESVIWLDGGRLRASGAAGATILQYDAAMLARDVATTGSAFLGWELDDGGHVLRDAGSPFRLRIHLAPGLKVSNGHFGLGLLGADDEVVAGWAFEPLSFNGGTRHLDVDLPQLPLRPGLYRWTVTLFDNGNNLTGGRLLEKWTAVPELSLDTRPLGHPQDMWAGVLNLRATLGIDGATRRVPSAEDAQ
jgi:hypothetical protein